MQQDSTVDELVWLLHSVTLSSENTKKAWYILPRSYFRLFDPT